MWLATVVVGAVGLYFSAYIQAFLGSALPVDGAEEASGRPPIEIVEVRQLFDPGTNIMVPAELTEQDLAGWDRNVGRPSEEWLNRHDALGIGQSEWQITLEGQRSREVVVTRMTPRLVGSCAAPLTGHMIENPSAGEGSKFRFEVAIDRPNPVFMLRPREGEPYPYFEDRTIRLPRGEKNVVVITASTSGPYCEWEVEVEYLADGKSDRLVIRPPDDEPFAVTGEPDPAQYRSVFISPLAACPEPYRQVPGTEYAAIVGGTADYCGG